MTTHVLGRAYRGAVMLFRRMETAPPPDTSRDAADEAVVLRTEAGDIAIEAHKDGTVTRIVLTPAMAETVAEILWRP